MDEEGGVGAAGLDRWLEEIDRCYSGTAATALGRELAESVARVEVPRSALEDIPGVCATRRRDLLRHFGSAQGVENASVEELKKISGISAKMAQQIYDHLHNIAD